MFGYKIEIENRQRYWGARAIFKGYSNDYNIDLMGDRQTSHGMSDSPTKEDQAFLVWLNERALPWLREEVKNLAIAPDESQEIIFKEFKYELRANAGSSCGYLYIGAVEHQVEEVEPIWNEMVEKSERVFKVGEETFVWGAEHDPPLPGVRGDVPCNSRGAGKVVGYFTEPYKGHKLLCLMVDLDSPPQWLVEQTMKDKIRKDMKAMRLPAKRGTDPDNCVPSPAALKEWKRNFKLGPSIVFDGDFKIEKKVA